VKKTVFSTALVAAVLMSPAMAHAQTTDQEASLLIGYSYLHVDQNGADNGGTHGIIADYTYFMDRRFGFVLSAAANWGDVDAGENFFKIPEVSLTQYTFLAGPHATLWRTLASELCVRAMAGVARRKSDGSNSGIDLRDEWGFATGAEAHLDFRLSDKIWLRAIQPAALWTNFGDQWQFNWRVSAGFVIRAGEILQ